MSPQGQSPTVLFAAPPQQDFRTAPPNRRQDRTPVLAYGRHDVPARVCADSTKCQVGLPRSRGRLRDNRIASAGSGIRYAQVLPDPNVDQTDTGRRLCDATHCPRTTQPDSQSTVSCGCLPRSPVPNGAPLQHRTTTAAASHSIPPSTSAIVPRAFVEAAGLHDSTTFGVFGNGGRVRW